MMMMMMMMIAQDREKAENRLITSSLPHVDRCKLGPRLVGRIESGVLFSASLKKIPSSSVLQQHKGCYDLVRGVCPGGDLLPKFRAGDSRMQSH